MAKTLRKRRLELSKPLGAHMQALHTAGFACKQNVRLDLLMQEIGNLLSDACASQLCKCVGSLVLLTKSFEQS